MQLISSGNNGILIEHVQSKVLDASTARAFKDAIKPLLTQNAKLVLDLSEIDFIDSTGLGALVSCLRQAHASGGEIKLTGLTNSARVLFELVRMHRVFEIFNSSAEAVASYGEVDMTLPRVEASL
jgi:anti-sigma B factor antagonist